MLLVAVVMVRTFTRGPIEFKALPADRLPNIEPETAAGLLARAVRYRTIATREAGTLPAEEFKAFRAFLMRTFPRTFRSLKLELVEGHTMLLTWQGTQPKLAPVILMGHYDVVPVSAETLPQWTVAPFAGEIKDGYIWGRGTIDDKHNVIGLLLAAETLLAAGHQPRRTTYLLFGHDEEVLGNGALSTMRLLQKRGVKPLYVLDEGGSIIKGSVPGVKAPVALIGTTEKGYLTIKLSAKTAGGHSSMPPPSTAIGIVAAAVHRQEENPMPRRIDGALADLFKHSGPHMPFVLRMAVANLWLFQPIVMGQLAGSKAGNASVRTTTAATVISGGVKENVLPEEASALVNFRLLPGDSVAMVKEHAIRAIGDERVKIEEVISNEASPVSPADGEAFALVAGATRAIFPDALVSPFMMVGSTDARHFTQISKNVLRFVPVRMDSADLARLHGVNERIGVKNFAEIVRFYMLLMQQG